MNMQETSSLAAATVAFGLTLLASGSAHAEWTVHRAPLGPGYEVRHDSGSPDLVVNKRFKTKKGAKKAAKALNKAEKKSDGGNHGIGNNAK